MASLVVGTVLIIWDWFWIAIGEGNQYFLGISHLVIDIWWFVLVITGFKHVFGTPIKWGIISTILAFMIAFPLSVLLMRSPL
jgi:hypothetical protein